MAHYALIEHSSAPSSCTASHTIVMYIRAHVYMSMHVHFYIVPGEQCLRTSTNQGTLKPLRMKRREMVFAIASSMLVLFVHVMS